ncbi:hypothetical protein FKM82_015918 [Ascaphus truei]
MALPAFSPHCPSLITSILASYLFLLPYLSAAGGGKVGSSLPARPHPENRASKTDQNQGLDQVVPWNLPL